MELLILGGLILLNGAFAMSEVALLTARKPRLETRAKQGDKLAAAALALARDPTRFLSTIQIGITSIGILNGIVGEAFLSAPVSAWLQATLLLTAKTANVVATVGIVVAITYVSIVVGELVPKRLGQHNAEGIARMVAWPMRVLARLSAPFVALLSASTHAILNPLLSLARIRGGEDEGEMSPEEIRTILLEYSNVLPKKHISILLNLFDLGAVTVQDIMVPRARIESLSLDEDMETIVRQIVTSHHGRLPVFRSALGDVVGVLHLKKVLTALPTGTLDKDTLESMLSEPYFVPATTPVLAQMQYFQENRERIALVVDEYGELMGLLTLEDIIEEIIGKFTTSLPSAEQALAWDAGGAATADGATPVREVNRALGLALPTDGPKTLNGLIVEHLQDIPEADVSIKIGNVPMEIVHAQGRTIKTVRIFRPVQNVENIEPSEV
ncbi:MAG TPA: CNNM domain-containing protein [Burkholderiales bacterium]|nr:CNNM domain-containing protein [Burkholderiales bacterium]